MILYNGTSKNIILFLLSLGILNVTLSKNGDINVNSAGEDSDIGYSGSLVNKTIPA